MTDQIFTSIAATLAAIFGFCLRDFIIQPLRARWPKSKAEKVLDAMQVSPDDCEWRIMRKVKKSGEEFMVQVKLVREPESAWKAERDGSSFATFSTHGWAKNFVRNKVSSQYDAKQEWQVVA